jgi:hypothetical protein
LFNFILQYRKYYNLLKSSKNGTIRTAAHHSYTYFFNGISGLFCNMGLARGCQTDDRVNWRFAAGLFLGIIGIIIIYCSSTVDSQFNPCTNLSPADELQKYKQLLDSGAITEAEYNLQKARILR